MLSITVLCIVVLHGDGKSTGTNLDDQPMYNTVMYIYIKWFVRMLNCGFSILFGQEKIFNLNWMFCVFAHNFAPFDVTV